MSGNVLGPVQSYGIPPARRGEAFAAEAYGIEKPDGKCFAPTQIDGFMVRQYNLLVGRWPA